MVTMKLSQLVRKHPVATTFLNDHHIDYCCGHDTLVLDAIQQAGFDKDVFLADLKTFIEREELRLSPTIKEELYDMSVDQLIDHLEATHHIDERELLSQVDQRLSKILVVHYRSHKDELIEVAKLFGQLRIELLIHFAQEEREVFPLMREDSSIEALEKVEALEADHENAGNLIKALTKATNNFTAPYDACPTYVSAYALMKKLVEDVFIHVFTENTILFPAYERGVQA